MLFIKYIERINSQYAGERKFADQSFMVHLN